MTELLTGVRALLELSWPGIVLLQCIVLWMQLRSEQAAHLDTLRSQNEFLRLLVAPPTTAAVGARVLVPEGFNGGGKKSEQAAQKP